MKSKHKRTIIILLTSAIFALLGASCGTIRGVGHDVEAVGDGIQDAAR